MKRKAKQPPFHIAHVGDMNTERDLSIRIIVGSWIARYANNLWDKKLPVHDFVDLNRGRDFLAETKEYDVVIVHYIMDGEISRLAEKKREECEIAKAMSTDPGFNRSPFDSADAWRRRLLGTNAQLIFAFGGSTEIARCYIGELEGYTVKEFFHPPPAQFGVWRKEAQ